MPSLPTTLPIAPSRLALALHGLVVLILGGVLLWAAPFWFALPGGLLLASLLPGWGRRQRRGELRLTPQIGGRTCWAWREGRERNWQEVRLSCDYLGPWLVGLRLDGRRLWVWPDSSDAASRRALRRALVHMP
ncbi:protein YgfX [Halomonas cerina]|uniref:Toxin CptA n=1 Tax=Halomonas cerina TaxID=447424 RepID=A0A839V927_9GAMM|nr:protein YgfX [Halomonas cerina]MBB3192153.1 hypothetical protein [Halomonas cerina]